MRLWASASLASSNFGAARRFGVRWFRRACGRTAGCCRRRGGLIIAVMAVSVANVASWWRIQIPIEQQCQRRPNPRDSRSWTRISVAVPAFDLTRVGRTQNAVTFLPIPQDGTIGINSAGGGWARTPPRLFAQEKVNRSQRTWHAGFSQVCAAGILFPIGMGRRRPAAAQRVAPISAPSLPNCFILRNLFGQTTEPNRRGTARKNSPAGGNLLSSMADDGRSRDASSRPTRRVAESSCLAAAATGQSNGSKSNSKTESLIQKRDAPSKRSSSAVGTNAARGRWLWSGPGGANYWVGPTRCRRHGGLRAKSQWTTNGRRPTTAVHGQEGRGPECRQ